MTMSETSAVERIARVLAGERASANAQGAEPSAGKVVDAAWGEHREEALAVLRTLREPDPAMAAAGDAGVWIRMVEAALDEAEAASPVTAGSGAMPGPAQGNEVDPGAG